MRMRVSAATLGCLAVIIIASAIPAEAQYRPTFTSNRATGETYHVEVGGYFWHPSPDILITADYPGIIGTPIDFVEELGIENQTFTQLKAVLRPATKHKFRFEYTPIRYDGEGALTRDVTFNGTVFPLTIPVGAELKWNAFRFGYEYDFVYRDRGFAGVLIEAKYTDVSATLENVLAVELIRARGPIPAIGFIGRGYVAPNISITGEFSFFKVPASLSEDYNGDFFDLDIYGTVNFNDHVGVQGGYRKFNIFYKIEEDTGDFKVQGLYFGGVFRF
jgi:hypothetical protein